MKWVQLQTTGSVVFDLPARPASAGTATVRDVGGAILTSPTPTLDSVNTTLSAGAAVGATTLAVTSATGITANRRYLLAGGDAAGGESVLVASISGTTVTLARPIARAAASGATFAPARITVAVASSATQSPARQHRIEWVDPTTSEVIAVPFDVVRYTPRSHLTQSLLLDLDASLRKRLPSGAWVPALIERAWEMLTDDLAGSEKHPGGYVGVIELTTAHAYLVRALVAETDTSAEGVAYRDDMRARYSQERERALAPMAYDAEGDGSAVVGAASSRTFSLVRA